MSPSIVMGMGYVTLAHLYMKGWNQEIGRRCADTPKQVLL